ncbi:MAG: hypothetical protein L0Y54_15805 [Sporichthyaceae bacterium]|nr:hypothetical protein [Sporichthyaceae bacterium]
MAPYRAKQDIDAGDGRTIRRGERVDRATAERIGKGKFVAEGDDYVRDEQVKQNARRALRRNR